MGSWGRKPHSSLRNTYKGENLSFYSLMMYSNNLSTDWFSMRAPALVLTNSPVFTCAFTTSTPFLSTATPVQLQAFVSSTSSTRSSHPLPRVCGWLSSTGLNQLNSLCDWKCERLWNTSHGLCMAFTGECHSSTLVSAVFLFSAQLWIHKSLLHSWLVGLTGAVWYFEEPFDSAPTCRLRTSVCVCSCSGVGERLCAAPWGMALGHRGPGLPQAEQNSGTNLPGKPGTFRQRLMDRAPQESHWVLVSSKWFPFLLDFSKCSAFALDLIWYQGCWERSSDSTSGKANPMKQCECLLNHFPMV